MAERLRIGKRGSDYGLWGWDAAGRMLLDSSRDYLKIDSVLYGTVPTAVASGNRYYLAIEFGKDYGYVPIVFSSIRLGSDRAVIYPTGIKMLIGGSLVDNHRMAVHSDRVQFVTDGAPDPQPNLLYTLIICKNPLPMPSSATAMYDDGRS